MSSRSLALIYAAMLCRVCSVLITETTPGCVPESEFTQHNCRCKKYTGYNVVRNDSTTNSTVLLSCRIPFVCVAARASARWTLSGLDAGNLIFSTGLDGPVLYRGINGLTIGSRDGVALDTGTGYMYVRTNIPKLLSKINCSATVYVFPPKSRTRTPAVPIEKRTTGAIMTAPTTTMTTETTETTETTILTTILTTSLTTITETIRTTILPTTIATAPTSFPTDEIAVTEPVLNSVPFQTFGDSIAVTIPLISEEDQTPLFIILGLIILCLALSLLLAVLYARGALGHRGGQWDTFAPNTRLRLPRMPRSLRDHDVAEAEPALP